MKKLPQILLDRNSVIQSISVFVFSILFVATPWETLYQHFNGDLFNDRQVYINYFLHEQNILVQKNFDSIASYFTNEVLWHYFIALLVSDFGINIEYVFTIISFLVIYVFGLLFIRWRMVWFLVFLVNPLVVAFAFSQLRLALAMSLLGFAYLSYRKLKTLPIVLSFGATLIHTGSIFFILIYIATNVVGHLRSRKLGNVGLLFFFMVVWGVFLSIMAGPAREILLAILNDRRADYDYAEVSSSVLYLSFWVSLIIPFYICRQTIMKFDYGRYAIAIIAIVCMDVVYGGYSTRFLAAGFPCVVASIFRLRGLVKYGTIVLLLAYVVFQWMYWLKFI